MTIDLVCVGVMVMASLCIGVMIGWRAKSGYTPLPNPLARVRSAKAIKMDVSENQGVKKQEPL